MYNLALLFIFGGLGLLGLGVYFFLKLKKEEELQRIRKMPFPEEYRNYLQRIELYRNLPKSDKERLERSILLFIHTKEFKGVQMQITNEIKVLVAFHACVMLLHARVGGCYENLQSIIVYPHRVVVEHINDNGGIFSKEKLLIEGESQQGVVVIVWDEAKRQVYHPRKENVLVHEFAHEIDFMDGIADGVPLLEPALYHEWVGVLYEEFKRLGKKVSLHRYKGKYAFLGEYAASNEAEFFAVASERFFQTPNALKRKFPRLYKELKAIYGIDTASLVSR